VGVAFAFFAGAFAGVCLPLLPTSLLPTPLLVSSGTSAAVAMSASGSALAGGAASEIDCAGVASAAAAAFSAGVAFAGVAFAGVAFAGVAFAGAAFRPRCAFAGREVAAFDGSSGAGSFAVTCVSAEPVLSGVGSSCRAGVPVSGSASSRRIGTFSGPAPTPDADTRPRAPFAGCLFAALG
jgi:hypothetical protein